METPSTRIAYLDGWRVFAVLLVFLDHLSMNREIGGFFARSPLGVLSEYGEVGVFIFFFISGYVVSLGALKEVAASGVFSARAFYVRRLFRIAPPLMFYLLCCLGLGLSGVIDFSFTNFFSSAFYLCNSTAPLVSCNWYVGHTWSLAFEEQFYCIFPVVFSYLELSKKPPLIPAAAAILVAAIPFVFTISWIGKTGCLIAYGLFFAGYAAAKHGRNWVARLRAHRGAALLAAAMVVFAPRSLVASFGDDEAARGELIAYYRLLHIAAIPVLVLLSGVAGGALHGLLSGRLLSRLGRATYSIYLWQQLFNGPVVNELDAASQLGSLAGVTLLCVALFENVEMNLIERGRTLSDRCKARGASSRPRPGAERADGAGPESGESPRVTETATN